MIINIGMIKVNSINTIGSMNIGKTILSRNFSTSTSYNTNTAEGDGACGVGASSAALQPAAVAPLDLGIPQTPT